jgi:3-phenylpropionate/trans-cinnamate dioxygenase ferredoxin reductase component
VSGSRPGRVVIVGASLAGLRGAESLRRMGFTGSLTIVGDEPHEPYDRPPLSKAVLTGWVPPEHTGLPRLADLGDVDWRLGVAATALDRRAREVVLADGTRLPYDRVLVATGVRNRPWPNAEQAALEGVRGIRTREDSRVIRDHLDAGPKRVLVVGAGFTGSEVASICRQRGLPVTVVERAENPLVGPLGGVVGEVAAGLQRAAGVDLRCNVTVEALEGSGGRFRAASLSDGTTVEAGLAVIALGALRNTEWLADSGLACGPLGVSCDPGGRAYAVGERRGRGAGGGAQHDLRRPGPPGACQRARVLVGAVRDEHQVRGRAVARRPDPGDPGVGQAGPVRRRLPGRGPDGGRGDL